MAAALGILAEKGFRATRLDEVATRAGVTKPLIYHYFEGKDDLVRKALEWRLGQVLSGMREELSETGGPWRGRLERFCRWQWEKWQDPKWAGLVQGVVAEMRQEAPELHRRWIRSAFLGRCEVVAEILQEAGDELRSGIDPDRAARLLLGTLWQSAVLMHAMGELREGGHRDSERILVDALDIFLSGVRRGEGER